MDTAKWSTKWSKLYWENIQNTYPYILEFRKITEEKNTYNLQDNLEHNNKKFKKLPAVRAKKRKLGCDC
jgi:hypothetical protein